jgi:ubiquinone/menaquinone biosynthesis C-methylase UbiE
MVNLAERIHAAEIMDDLTRPDEEFQRAYDELQIINRWLGGVRAIDRFLPRLTEPTILDVAAGACDVSEAVAERIPCRMVVIDVNALGLKRARKSLPVVADAFDLPFGNASFDVVMASLFFHHLSDDGCVRVLSEMWRVARKLVLVNDLHRHRVAYWSIRLLTALFSSSVMVRHDGPLSVRRAFRPAELLGLAKRAQVPARVRRSFPFRLVLVAEK